MITTQTKTFETKDGPKTISVGQLPAMRAGKLLVRLGRVLGPSVAALAKVAKGGDATEAFAEGVGLLFEKLTPEEFDALARELLQTATVEGEAGELLRSIDLTFQGRVGELFKLIAFALQVNFADFSDALGGLAKLAPGALSRFTASSTSSGQRNG